MANPFGLGHLAPFPTQEMQHNNAMNAKLDGPLGQWLLNHSSWVIASVTSEELSLPSGLRSVASMRLVQWTSVAIQTRLALEHG